MYNPNLDSNSHLDPTETEQSAPMSLETARRIEQEKLTRRAALRKLGFGAGMAAFAMLGVDDFARLVGKRMERMAGDNKVAGQIAKEFQSAGIALADNPSGTCGADCSTCSNNLRKTGISNCKANYALPGPCMGAVNSCVTDCNAGCPDVDATAKDIAKFTQCYDSCTQGKGFPVANY